MLSAQSVAEMFPPPKKYIALGRKPLQVDRAQLYEDLKQYGRFTVLKNPHENLLSYNTRYK